MKLNDFEYTIENGRPKVKHGKPEPKSLFKYYSLNEYSVDALIKNYLYASHPFELNDITDSSYSLLHIDKRPDFKLYEFVYGQFPQLKSKGQIKAIFEKDVDGDLFKKEFWLYITSQSGIISLSHNEYSSLMWPHYTNETGFQIEFIKERLIESQKNNIEDKRGLWFSPINYVSNKQVINMTDKIKKNPILAFLYITNIKDQNWVYEEEWRINLHNGFMGIPFSKRDYTGLDTDISFPKNQKRKIPYSQESITSITLGSTFINHKVFKIREIGGMVREVRVIFNKSIVIPFLNYINNNLNVPIFISESKKLPYKKGLELKRVKRQIILEKISAEKFRITYTKNMFNEEGRIEESQPI